MIGLSHEQLWAPWRLGYILGEDKAGPKPLETSSLEMPPGADPGCFLCRDVADDDDQANLVVYRGAATITVLNRYPYNNGHVLVAPAAHKAHPKELTDDEHLECQQMIARLVGVIEQTMRAEGFNIGLNLGKTAGAGLPGHLHWHIVPRWNGDTNFMPVLAGVKSIPQSLESLWELLHNALK